MIHLIIIMKSEISIFPIVVIFVQPYAGSFIYIPERWVFCLLCLCSLMMCANNRVYSKMLVRYILSRVCA